MPNLVINGVQYASVPQIDVPKSGGGTAHFFDTTDATGTLAHVLAPDTVYTKDGKGTGTMPNNGATGGTIATKDGTVTIPAGYTSGGTVGLSDTAKASIITDNIKAGSSILGVSGKSTVVDTAIASGGAGAGQIMSGYKGFVNGVLVNGSATVPTVSQDSSTKVLTIA